MMKVTVIAALALVASGPAYAAKSTDGCVESALVQDDCSTSDVLKGLGSADAVRRQLCAKPLHGKPAKLTLRKLASDDDKKAAQDLLTKRCGPCHDGSTAGKKVDFAALVASPMSNPEWAEYAVIRVDWEHPGVKNNPGMRMPKAQEHEEEATPLSADEQALLKRVLALE